MTRRHRTPFPRRDLPRHRKEAFWALFVIFFGVPFLAGFVHLVELLVLLVRAVF